MKRIIPIIVIIVIIVVGVYQFTRPPAAASEPGGDLVGSGAIEAETVVVVPEIGGRVTELKAAEGDEVAAGQVLLELDKSDLLAQQSEVKAALATAKANLEATSAPPRPEEIAAAQAQLAQAEAARDGAKLTWQRIEAVVNQPHELEAKITQARAEVTAAERKLEMARVSLKRAEIGAEAAGRDQTTRMGANEGIVGAQAAGYQVQSAEAGVQMAEVALAGAKQQVEHLVRLRNKPLQLIAERNAAEAAYRQAEAAVKAAEANLAAVKAGPRPEDIAIARAEVAAAEAALAAVQVQLDKLTLAAPRAGLIRKALIDPGELAAPGMVLMELSDIDTVDLVVYIPETQIGQVQIGQGARVYVDAYENELFEGTITYIDHEAEFTPKNVQTKEERANLVFAVKISLDNPDHRLRPGMPADAEIIPGLQTQLVAAPTPTPSPRPASIAALTPTPESVDLMPTIIPSPTSTPPPSPTPPTRQAEVVSWALNVRSGPGVDYPVVASLAQGQTVPILDVHPGSGWLQVELPDGEETGWISGKPDYVSVIDEE